MWRRPSWATRPRRPIARRSSRRSRPSCSRRIHRRRCSAEDAPAPRVAELGRIGGRAPSPLDLTPTEARIAELVADGQTNREVAAAVFLSEKTVETNLTRIYRKLGVTSRRELARRIRSR
jgi:DNA-binding NarL/FixJ family response regulator